MSQWMHGPLGGDAPPGIGRWRRAASTAMSLVMLWFANQVSLVTPHARLFGLRRRLFVLAGCDIHPGAKLGATVRIHHSNIKIGDSWIAPGVELYAGPDAPIVIGHKCAIGGDTVINSYSHEFGPHDNRTGRSVSRPIHIGDGTFVAARSTIAYGASLGNGCVVGLCTLIREDFGDDLLIVGIPGKVIRELPIDGYGEGIS